MYIFKIRFSKKKINLIIWFFSIFSVIFCHLFGVFIFPFETDLDPFLYPLVLDNLSDLIDQYKSGINFTATTLPFNQYNYPFLINQNKCLLVSQSINKNTVAEEAEIENNNETKKKHQEIFLLIIVKSSLGNRDKREAIRKTWGYEKRFSDIQIRVIFSLGNCNGLIEFEKSKFKKEFKHNCQEAIIQESQIYRDIVQSDFSDTYYNNSIKTMMSLKWVVIHCPTAQFVLLIDDDYYLSIKNLLKYIRNVFQPSDDSLDIPDSLTYRYYYDYRLYSGFVFSSSWPIRNKLSKWYLSLDEYPYSKFPPYVTAGSILLSNSALFDMYFSSFFTKHFRFDDIYLAILAKKVKLKPIHNSNFHFWKKYYTPQDYSQVISSHGYDNSKELIKVWEEQKSLGHA